MFPKHYCLQLKSFAFYSCFQIPVSLLQSGTHTGDYFIGGASLFKPLDGFFFTLHGANFVINISGNTQWHFKWNTNEKTLLFLVTRFSQIWKEITVKLAESYLSFLNGIGCCHYSAKLSFSSPLDRNYASFGATVGRKLKYDIFRGKKRFHEAKRELLPLAFGTHFCFVGSCRCERVHPRCTDPFLDHSNQSINQYMLIHQLIDEETLPSTGITDEDYAFNF